MALHENCLVRAREDGLAVKDVGDELAVYDLRTDQVHLLNPTTAAVWKSCQQLADLGQIRSGVTQLLGTDPGDDLVIAAIAELNGAGLLAPESALPISAARFTRRSLMKKAAVLAVAVPAITTILAPPAAAQASTCLPSGTPGCTTNANCCTNAQPCTKEGASPTGVCGGCKTWGSTGCVTTAPSTNLCCSGVCTSVKGGTKCCKTSGTCGGATECCSGICTGGICTTCQPVNGPCTSNAQCCSSGSGSGNCSGNTNNPGVCLAN